MRQHMVRFVAAALIGLALWGQAPRAHAQDGAPLKGNIAGTFGLGMLGAELGLVLVPTAKLQDHWWAWALFPTLGAAGGAVAGALAFDAGNPDPAVTISLLGAGMTLAVPAVVAAVAIRDRRRNKEPMELESGAVIRVGKVRSHFGVPSVAAVPVFTPQEQQRYGLRQRAIVDVPLISGRF